VPGKVYWLLADPSMRQFFEGGGICYNTALVGDALRIVSELSTQPLEQGRWRGGTPSFSN